MKKILVFPAVIAILAGGGCRTSATTDSGDKILFQPISEVEVTDQFWAPKFDQWLHTTGNDVWNKFESRHLHDPAERESGDTFRNFDLVAEGKRDIGHHAGEPWFDGLVYETIRGLSDFMLRDRDPAMEARIDGYIERIARAQASEPDGFINTWTQLMESDHRWGENGGMLRWQHDVYNAGMLVEAGIHYYQTTGKTRLLEVATRFTNMMCATIGPEPKKNVVPAHSGPEEPLVMLYWLFRDNPEARAAIEAAGVPVDPGAYWELARFFIENRGYHVGFPLWGTWGGGEADRWIRANEYDDPKYGTHRRPTWGDYAQDSIPVFRQQTIEGHAVRATLLATGIATAALENDSPEYISTVTRLWDNMAGRRMFITGGVGAVHFDEKFGPDYFLPTDAYLETCAAVGAGFFSQRMNELTGDAKYLDELERTLYNGVLTGISLSGVNYTYQNPLNAHAHGRWEWHSCPCCPPMFLKIMSAVPGYIYSRRGDDLFVNLFIGSNTRFTSVGGASDVSLSVDTRYPWEGLVSIAVNPSRDSRFSLRLRVPGWAVGVENPYGLYTSSGVSGVGLKVNGQPVELRVEDGFAVIDRRWSSGDVVEFVLPMEPRVVRAHPEVAQLQGMVALSAGPMVYGLESADNVNLDGLVLDPSAPMSVEFDSSLMGGMNVVRGRGVDSSGAGVDFAAVPYFAVGNRVTSQPYKVWLSAR